MDVRFDVMFVLLTAIASNYQLPQLTADRPIARLLVFQGGIRALKLVHQYQKIKNL